MAVLTVCASGCDYSTIAGALAVAAAVDIIELTESRIEQVQVNTNVTAIRGTSQAIVWESDSNGGCLEIIGGLTQQMDIYNLTMLKSSANGRCVLWVTYGSGAKLHMYDVIMQMTVPTGGGRAIVQIQPDITTGVDSLFFERCQIIGNAKSQWGIRPFGQSVANSFRVQNCIFRDLPDSGALDAPDGGASVQVSRVYNNTFENCVLALNLIGRADAKNNLFINNTDDVGLGTFGDYADAAYNAFEQATVGEGSWGSNNIFGITSTDEVEDEVNHDFKLKGDAQSVDAGDDLSGLVDDDIDGLERPLGAGHDIGAHERPYPIETTELV